MSTTHKLPCLVAIADYTHVGSATASFKDLVTIQENSPIKELQPPLVLVTVSKEQEVHEPNSRTEHSLILVNIINKLV